MPTPRLEVTPEGRRKMAEALEAVKKHDGNIVAAANALGLPWQTLRGRYLRAKFREQNAQTDVAAEVPPHAEAIARARLEREIERLRAELRGTRKQLLAETDFREAVFKLGEMRAAPPNWMVQPAKKGIVRQTPILFTSDWQYGEVVVPSEVNYFNEYNVEIAERRKRRLLQTTLDLCFEHEADPNYDGIYFLRGGDEISGSIHEELAQTDELQSLPSIQRLLDLDAEIIETLKKHFKRVYVISVPGNHGRTTVKPHAKRYSDLNYEHHLAWMLEREFKPRGKDVNPDIRFYTPKSGDAFFKVYDVNCLLTHGDRIGSRGGQGFIGPQATILRGMRKTIAQYAAQQKRVDKVFTGHFHTSCDLGIGFGNGSGVGYNEYAHMLRCDPEPPQQLLAFAHPKRGITHTWWVQLDDAPARVAAREMAA